jgi:alkylation response protein AidB-like acyl-CoA dehydrogenase
VNLDLTDEQKATPRLAREFAQNEVKRVAEELEKEKRFPYEIVAKLGELGLMGVPYPEEYGFRRPLRALAWATRSGLSSMR